jgi:hypothetical protein
VLPDVWQVTRYDPASRVDYGSYPGPETVYGDHGPVELACLDAVAAFAPTPAGELLAAPSRTLVRMELAHYAEAFIVSWGRCFRFVAGDDPRRQGQPAPCRRPVACRGTFRAPGGRHYRVDACAGHAGPLRDRRPATS